MPVPVPNQPKLAATVGSLSRKQSCQRAISTTRARANQSISQPLISIQKSETTSGRTHMQGTNYPPTHGRLKAQCKLLLINFLALTSDRNSDVHSELVSRDGISPQKSLFHCSALDQEPVESAHTIRRGESRFCSGTDAISQVLAQSRCNRLGNRDTPN